MFDFNNTLNDIDRSQKDTINEISLKLINPCEIFYYMYDIPIKGIPTDNNGFYEITNISNNYYWLFNQSNNPDDVYNNSTFEHILYNTYFKVVELNDIPHIELPLLPDDMTICNIFTNEYFIILYIKQNNNTYKRYENYLIKCNKLPNIEGPNYYEVLNELRHTLNYIDYRKTFKLDNSYNSLCVCNSMLNYGPFFFCKNNNKAYFIYYIAGFNFYLSHNKFKSYKDNLHILLGTDYNIINWLNDNLLENNLLKTKHAIINGKDTNITISNKVYNEIPSYVQKFFKSKLGINKNNKSKEYTMRAIVIDIK